MRRPWPIALIGLDDRRRSSSSTGFKLNPSEAQVKDLPGAGRCDRRARQCSPRPGSRPGVMKPFVVLVEHGGATAPVVARRCGGRPGSPAPSHRPARLAQGRRQPGRGVPGDRRCLEGHASTIISQVKAELTGTDATLGGVAAEDRDFVSGRLLELPLRARLRRAADRDPAHTCVPLARARDQGGGAEPALARAPPTGSS